MSLISKLYSYYLSNLFRKNWIRLFFFTLIALVGTWFVIPYGCHYIWKNRPPNIFPELGKLGSFQDAAKKTLSEPEVRTIFEWGLKEEKVLLQALETAREGGNESDIEKAEEKLLQYHQGVLAFSSVFPLPPIIELDYNKLSLGVETENPHLGNWRSINKLSFWALGTGFSFTYLTLALTDFLFLSPKKNGEEATVLTFTPGVKRSDLLISKILVFLTYYSLFALVTFVLPGFCYCLWAGSLAPLNLVWLFLYTLLAAPLLAFGLVILPYILLSSWSSLMGSLFSYTIFSITPLFLVFGHRFLWAFKIRDLFFNPLIFVPLALGVGAVCLTLYYYQSQSEDLKD